MAIRRMTIEAIEDCHKRDIVYVEQRFCPHLLATSDNEPLVYPDFSDRENVEPHSWTKSGSNTARVCPQQFQSAPEDPITPTEVLETVLEAAEYMKTKLPQIKVKFIMSAIVAFPQWSLQLAEMCVKYRSRGVVGIDLAGSTDGISADGWAKHKAAFDFAKENNVHITVHAGEAEGPQSCTKAVDELHATRIGHGYHIVDDEKVYDRFKAEQYHLECCPRSSYLTGAVKVGVPHPLIR